jgi:gamma-glutamyltranspeptidase/glutathione hydrolase
VWDAESKRLYGLNASGRSPQSLSIEHFRENGYDKIPAYGPLPVSVPGCVDGWFELHKRFGSMDMDQILKPAINYAREGFPVTELIAYYWAGNAKSLRQKERSSKIPTWLLHWKQLPRAAGMLFTKGR